MVQKRVFIASLIIAFFMITFLGTQHAFSKETEQEMKYKNSKVFFDEYNRLTKLMESVQTHADQAHPRYSQIREYIVMIMNLESQTPNGQFQKLPKALLSDLNPKKKGKKHSHTLKEEVAYPSFNSFIFSEEAKRVVALIKEEKAKNDPKSKLIKERYLLILDYINSLITNEYEKNNPQK